MRRFIQSLILGALIGLVAGLGLGWFSFPPQSRDRPFSELAQRHRDDYRVMIAAGFAHDGDLPGAIDRLAKLEIAEAGADLRVATERVIRDSSRSLADIRLLVGLAAALRQLTPMMQPFHDASDGGL